MTAQSWHPNFPACGRCGRTDRPHHAHGLCASCNTHVGWPDRWPRWLAGCLRCRRPKEGPRKVAYYRSGLCRACDREVQDEGPAEVEIWRVEFVQQRLSQRGRRDYHNVLARILGERIGATDAAALLRCPRPMFIAWALFKRPVPAQFRRRLEHEARKGAG